MTSGGSRLGSGRKAADPKTKRVQFSVCLAPDTVRRIRALRAKGVKIGPLVDYFFSRYCEDEE